MPNPFANFLNFLGDLLPGKGRALAGSMDLPQAVAEEEFLHWGEWASHVSTNVSGFLYDAPGRKLTVQYRGSAFYQYENVGEEEAHSAFIAASAGRWCWDTLRVRGTRCSHRKDYTFLSAVSSWQPKHPCSAPAVLGPPATQAEYGAALGQIFGPRRQNKKPRRR